MSAWIEIDGVKSNAFEGVTVEEVTPFLLPKLKASRVNVPGLFGQVDQGETSFEIGTINIKLLVSGSDREAATGRVIALHKWLTGTKLRIWRDAQKYSIGRVESGAIYEPVSRKTYRVSFSWTACPPCYFEAKSKQAGFEPMLSSPIPEQITAQTETTSASLAAVGRLPVMQDGGTHAPCLYFVAVGTWTQLTIGDLTIMQAAATEKTVYVDCENQVVYSLDSGNRVHIPYSGDFPQNDASGIKIGGTAFSATVRALMIERW